MGQFLVLVYLLVDGIVELVVQLHHRVQLLTPLPHPHAVLVHLVHLVLQQLVLRPQLLDLQSQRLALLGLLLVPEEEVVLFTTQLAIVLLQVLLIALLVRQLLDTLVLIL